MNLIYRLPMYFWIGLLSVFIFACDSLEDRPIESRKMAQAIKDRKPQRITEKDLLEWVKRKGNQWSFLAQKDLYRQIKRALADSTLKKIDDFDDLPAPTVVDSLAQMYLVDIQLYSLAKTSKFSKELQNIIAPYQQKQASQEPIVRQGSDKQNIYYASPVVIDNAVIGIWLITFPLKSARSRYDYKELLK